MNNKLETFFEKDRWINHLVETYHYTLYNLNQTYLLHVKSSLFGNRLISLPFSDYGKINNLDLDDLRKITSQTEAKYVEVRVPQWKKTIINNLSENNFFLGVRYKTFLLDIDHDEETIWRKMNKKIRNSIRASVKRKVKIKEIETIQDLKTYYNLYLKESKEIGSPPHSYNFFTSLFKNLRKNVVINIALKEDKPIAGLIIFLGEKWANLWQSISLHRYRNLNASYLLIWDSITKLSSNGFRIFDFGRTREETGIHFFKKRWGGYEQDIYHFIFSENKQYKKIDPYDRKFIFLSKIWRKLPIKIIEKIGNRTIGGIAL